MIWEISNNICPTHVHILRYVERFFQQAKEAVKKTFKFQLAGLVVDLPGTDLGTKMENIDTKLSLKVV